MLAAGPLLPLPVARRDVVAGRVPQYVVECIIRRDVLTVLADNDTQFSLAPQHQFTSLSRGVPFDAFFFEAQENG